MGIFDGLGARVARTFTDIADLPNYEQRIAQERAEEERSAKERAQEERLASIGKVPYSQEQTEAQPLAAMEAAAALNPKLLRPLPSGTSVANATMPQGGYTIPEPEPKKVEDFLPSAGRSYGVDEPLYIEPETDGATPPQAAPRYLAEKIPDGELTKGPAPVPELVREEPLALIQASAPQVGMDPRYAAGVEDRRQTLADLKRVFKEGEQPIQDEEKKYTARMGEYATDLGRLKDTRAKLDTARGVERQIESADMARTAMQFDANRVFSDVASSPLGTAGLALASGIVQGLNGYAGLDKPDAILASIKEAATRDVGNQVKMSEAGEKSRLGTKNAYDEAIKMGADKQEAVRLAAMASLDQIGKGLDFMKARQVRAKDRADLEIASGALKSEVGKEFTKLYMDNAQMTLQASIANLSNRTHMQIAQAKTDKEIRALTEKQYNDALEDVGKYIRDPDKGGAMVKNVVNSIDFYEAVRDGLASGKKIEELVSKNWSDSLVEKLTNLGKEKDTGVIMSVFDQQVSTAIKEEKSPEKKRILSIVASAYGDKLRADLGKSQTSPELVNQNLITDLKDPNSVLRFMKKNLTDARTVYEGQVALSPPTHKSIWDLGIGNRVRVGLELEREVLGENKDTANVRK